MILSISTNQYPATDLGYILHKHPDKFHTFDLSVGKAYVFYPEISEEKTTISLLLDIDPIEMVRGGKNIAGDSFALGHYVNDRPYVASSFLSVAIAKAFSTAMNGTCKFNPELVQKKIPFEISITSLPAATEGKVYIDKSHEWQMQSISDICEGATKLFLKTPYKIVSVNDPISCEELIEWWLTLTQNGGEGMVVKPFDFISHSSDGLLQPAIKCRGSEYLRIIYGQEYDTPENLQRLKNRGLSGKQSLAICVHSSGAW